MKCSCPCCEVVTHFVLFDIDICMTDTCPYAIYCVFPTKSMSLNTLVSKNNFLCRSITENPELSAYADNSGFSTTNNSKSESMTFVHRLDTYHQLRRQFAHELPVVAKSEFEQLGVNDDHIDVVYIILRL